MWVLFGFFFFFLLSQLDGLGAVGLGLLNCVFLFVCLFFKYMQPAIHPCPCPWKSLRRMSLALLVCIQSTEIPGRGGGVVGWRGGGVRGRVNCAPESEADRVSLVMLLSPWRWLERRGGGGGEDILGRVGADATS